MSLMAIMLKDISVLVGMTLEHWIHMHFVKIKIGVFGESHVRALQLEALERREQHLVAALQDSIQGMREYRALVKAGYNPVELKKL